MGAAETRAPAEKPDALRPGATRVGGYGPIVPTLGPVDRAAVGGRRVAVPGLRRTANFLRSI